MERFARLERLIYMLIFSEFRIWRTNVAKATLNPFFGQFHGRIGDLVFKRYGDQIVVTSKPDMSGVQWTEAQQAARVRFGLASKAAKQLLADPVRRAEYAIRAQALGKPIFALALADCYRSAEEETPKQHDTD
jgi:hypothetical protein